MARRAARPICPTCGQPFKPVRVGVTLTDRQAAIFDAVERAGSDGIEPRELRAIVYGDADVTPQIIAVHVRQINDRLQSTDTRIKCGRGRYANYRVVRVRVPGPMVAA